MTKNNLEDHLSWLLRTRPFIPPVAGQSSAPVTSGPSPRYSQGTLDGSTPTRSPKKTESSITSPTIGSLGRANLVEGYAQTNPLKKTPTQGYPTNTSGTLNPRDSGTMARLQSAPKSASKPRLLRELSIAQAPKERLSQDLGSTAATTTNNAPTSLRDRYSEHCRRVGGGQGWSQVHVNPIYRILTRIFARYSFQQAIQSILPHGGNYSDCTNNKGLPTHSGIH
jgi:hypothetical protein